jgi:ankyrin repeat protein
VAVAAASRRRSSPQPEISGGRPEPRAAGLRLRRARGIFAAAISVAALALAAPAKTPDAALLPDAAEREDWEAVAALLGGGAPPGAPQADGMTALHWAAYHDHQQTVDALLAADAEAGAANRYGVTPLALACTNGNANVVAALIAAGSDANSTGAGGEPVLLTAARTGRPEPVRLLLAAGADANATDRRGQTALMWAASEGHAEVAGQLIEAGADLGRRLPSGFDAMLLAARDGRRQVTRHLLAAGVDVNAVIDRRNGPRGPRRGTSALLLAVENAHFDLATDLLKAGADPDDQRSGFAPLHVLTWVRKPNRGDDLDGLPPPDGSGELTSLEFVKDLIDHGADVDLRLTSGGTGGPKFGTKGATPLLMAAKTADLPLVRLLVELGADPLAPNADGTTPLMATAGVGNLAPTEEAGTEDEAIATAEYLLGLGAEIDTIDHNGETAMHGAAYKSFPKMVEFLDARGADIAVWNQKNRHGWTPLLIAQGFRQGNFKPAPATADAIAKVMLAHGIDPPPPPPRDPPGKGKKGY